MPLVSNTALSNIRPQFVINFQDKFDGACVFHHQFCFQKSSHCAEFQMNNQGVLPGGYMMMLHSVSSFGAQGYANSLSYPAGREQLLCEGTVEGVDLGLAIAVVGQRPCFVVQQHANATVLRIAHQSLVLAIVPCTEFVIVKLQAPWQLVHTHHAPLPLLLPGNGLVGHLSKQCSWIHCCNIWAFRYVSKSNVEKCTLVKFQMTNPVCIQNVVEQKIKVTDKGTIEL